MGTDQPLLLVFSILASGVVAKWWWDDYRATMAGRPPSRSLPGTTRAPRSAHLIAIAGAVALVVAESAAEHAIGISDQQTKMTVLFGAHTLGAAFLEEVIFRGYVIAANRGRALLVASAAGASMLFALLHPFLWAWQGGTLQFQGDAKAWFSTAALFTGSLWFYYVRFMPTNPRRSLLPSITAHLARNLAVFAIKLLQGHVTGWW